MILQLQCDSAVFVLFILDKRFFLKCCVILLTSNGLYELWTDLSIWLHFNEYNDKRNNVNVFETFESHL